MLQDGCYTFVTVHLCYKRAQRLLHICYTQGLTHFLQEGSMIVTHLCFCLNQTGVNTEWTIPVVTRGVNDCYTFVAPRGRDMVVGMLTL